MNEKRVIREEKDESVNLFDSIMTDMGLGGNTTSSGSRKRLFVDKIELQGFKSFRDKVTIGPFHREFTCIIGPNGSGKSNIIDALCFVFGMESRHLRSKNVGELVNNQLPNGSAEVTVHFYIPRERENRFSVTRRIHSNRSSSYHLNRTTSPKHRERVKKKQIIEYLREHGFDMEFSERNIILQHNTVVLAHKPPKELLSHVEKLIGTDTIARELDEIEEVILKGMNVQVSIQDKIEDLRREDDTLAPAVKNFEDYVEGLCDLEKKRFLFHRGSSLHAKHQREALGDEVRAVGMDGAREGLEKVTDTFRKIEKEHKKMKNTYQKKLTASERLEEEFDRFRTRNIRRKVKKTDLENQLNGLEDEREEVNEQIEKLHQTILEDKSKRKKVETELNQKKSELDNFLENIRKGMSSDDSVTNKLTESERMEEIRKKISEIENSEEYLECKHLKDQRIPKMEQLQRDLGSCDEDIKSRSHTLTIQKSDLQDCERMMSRTKQELERYQSTRNENEKQTKRFEHSRKEISERIRKLEMERQNQSSSSQSSSTTTSRRNFGAFHPYRFLMGLENLITSIRKKQSMRRKKKRTRSSLSSSSLGNRDDVGVYGPSCVFSRVKKPEFFVAVNTVMRSFLQNSVVVESKLDALEVINFVKSRKIGIASCELLSHCTTYRSYQSPQVNGLVRLVDALVPSEVHPKTFSVFEKNFGSWYIAPSKEIAIQRNHESMSGGRKGVIRRNIVTQNGEIFYGSGEIRSSPWNLEGLDTNSESVINDVITNWFPCPLLLVSSRDRKQEIEIAEYTQILRRVQSGQKGSGTDVRSKEDQERRKRRDEEIMKLRSQLDEVEGKIDVLRSEKLNLVRSCDKASDSLEHTLGPKIIRLKRQIQVNETSLGEARRKKDSIRDDLSSLQSGQEDEQASEEDEFRRFEVELKRLYDELGVCRETYRREQEFEKKLRDEYEDILREIGSLDHRLTRVHPRQEKELESALTKAKSSLAGMSKKIENHLNEVELGESKEEETFTELKQLQSELRILKKKVNEFESKVEEARSDVHSAQSKLKEVEEQVNSKMKELEHWKQKEKDHLQYIENMKKQHSESKSKKKTEDMFDISLSSDDEDEDSDEIDEDEDEDEEEDNNESFGFKRLRTYKKKKRKKKLKNRNSQNHHHDTILKQKMKLSSTMAKIEEYVTNNLDDLKIYDDESYEDFSTGQFDESKLQELEFEIKSLEKELEAQQTSVNVNDYERHVTLHTEIDKKYEKISKIETKIDSESAKKEEKRTKRFQMFIESINSINEQLKSLFAKMENNQSCGYLHVDTTNSSCCFEEGIVYFVKPEGNEWKLFSKLSGGQQAVATCMLSLALQACFPSPIFFYDEIDAALDTENITKIASIIKELSNSHQFIIITLRFQMIERSKRLIGVYQTNEKVSLTIRKDFE